MSHETRSMSYVLADEKAFAKAAFESGILPFTITSEDQALGILLTGAELGLKRMQSFHHLYYHEGQIAMKTDLLASLFLARGGNFKVRTRTATDASVFLEDRNGNTLVYTLTITECVEARWHQRYDPKTKTWIDKEHWLKMPTTMLWYRCLANGIRLLDPGCTFGCLLEDEILDQQIGSFHSSSETPCDDDPVFDGAEAECETSPIRVRRQPTPEAGFSHWSDKDKALFWKQMLIYADYDEVLKQLGVESMDSWPYSAAETNPILEVCAIQPELLPEDLCQILFIKRLSEITEYYMDVDEIRSLIEISCAR